MLINWRWHDFGQVLINIDIEYLDDDGNTCAHACTQ